MNSPKSNGPALNVVGLRKEFRVRESVEGVHSSVFLVAWEEKGMNR